MKKSRSRRPLRAAAAPRSRLRPVSIVCDAVPHAEGSCIITQGKTQVLVTATVEAKVPPFLQKTGLGWITAEYGMLPRATHERTAREAARGKQSGRTLEIQRLIGRALRGVADRSILADRTITLDCDVLVADAGTRCASVTGAYVALMLAARDALQDARDPRATRCARPSRPSRSASRPPRRRSARDPPRPRLRGGLDGRGRPQRRRDVLGALRRDPGHGGEGAVRRGDARRAPHGGPARALASSSASSAPRSRGACRTRGCRTCLRRARRTRARPRRAAGRPPEGRSAPGRGARGTSRPAAPSGSPSRPSAARAGPARPSRRGAASGVPLSRSERGGAARTPSTAFSVARATSFFAGPGLRLDGARDERLLAGRVALEPVGGGVPQRGLGHALEDGAARHRLPLERVREAVGRGAEGRHERERRDAGGRERRDLAGDAPAERVAREKHGLLRAGRRGPSARAPPGSYPVRGLRAPERPGQVQRLDREVLRERDAGVGPVGRAAAEPVEEDEGGFRLLGGHRGEC